MKHCTYKIIKRRTYQLSEVVLVSRQTYQMPNLSDSNLLDTELVSRTFQIT